MTEKKLQGMQAAAQQDTQLIVQLQHHIDLFKEAHAHVDRP